MIVDAYLRTLFGESAKEDIPEEIRALTIKLKQIRIPEIRFENIPFREALGSLQKASVEFDSEVDSQKRGVNLVLNGNLPNPEPRVTLSLFNVSLNTALQYTVSLAGFEFRLEDDLIVIQPPEETSR